MQLTWSWLSGQAPGGPAGEFRLFFPPEFRGVLRFPLHSLPARRPLHSNLPIPISRKGLPRVTTLIGELSAVATRRCSERPEIRNHRRHRVVSGNSVIPNPYCRKMVLHTWTASATASTSAELLLTTLDGLVPPQRRQFSPATVSLAIDRHLQPNRSRGARFLVSQVVRRQGGSLGAGRYRR